MSSVRVLVPLILTVLSAATLPGQTQTPGAQESPVPTIRMQVTRVLVPVLVLDKAGKPVAGLTKDDFQVFDEGKPHEISTLTVLEDETKRSEVAANDPARAEDSHPVAEDAHPTARPQRFVVFLMDDLHMDVSDLKNVQKAASAVLSGSLDSLDYAGLLSMSAKSYTRLTRDRAKLLVGINSVQIQAAFQHTAFDCPDISYYQAVQIDRDRSADSPAFQTAMESAHTCFPNVGQQQLEADVRGAVQRTLSIGRQDTFSSYSVIASAIQALSVLPGERHLIFVSPGFETIEQDALMAESGVLDLALEANVAISVLDTRGLYVENIGASERGIATVRHNANGVQQDLRFSSMSNASNTMASLAYGTGGNFFHNNNDLQEGFRNLTQVPGIEYVLELSPDGLKADGKYHSLKVRVRRKGVTLMARQGYVAPKPERPKKSK